MGRVANNYWTVWYWNYVSYGRGYNMVNVAGICDYCGRYSNNLQIVEHGRVACPNCMEIGYKSPFGEM